MGNVDSAMSEDLSIPEERLLRLLATFSSSLEKAWDVTRELSLPGMSESLGVVRSALNIPLTSLEQRGFLFKRMAHVIGGGLTTTERLPSHRRRTFGVFTTR